MQDKLATALALYQADKWQAALEALPPLVGLNVPYQALALKANIHVKLAQPLEAGEAFLQAIRAPGADRPMMAQMATRMFMAAGATERLANAAPQLLTHLSTDPAQTFDILSALHAVDQAAAALPFIFGLDLANAAHAMLGINLLRAVGNKAALLGFVEEVLKFNPDDGLFNAERFSAALDLCDFAVVADCLRMIGDKTSPATNAGANMFAAQSVHRRLMWCDDEAKIAKPGLEHFLLRALGPSAAPLPKRVISPASQPLKIAYLSNDFYNHATMTLFREVLLTHDAAGFDIALFCYTAADRVGEQASWPERLKSRIHPLRDLDDLAAARAISHWGADILVDLKGFTGGARLNIVRLSDAPLTVTYLGYPGSVNGVGFDYAITDKVVTPTASFRFYDEKLCRLPECYQANDCVSRPLPGAANRRDHGLPENAFVFASFNVLSKITRAMVTLWSRILKACPGSVFWCLCGDDMARGNLMNAFAEEGVAAERIIYAGFAPYASHVSRVALADLVLDTFPCNGHTTTSDLLWAGVPVLALSGNSFASRVSESLLRALGMPDLAVHSAEDYVGLAVDLFDNRARLTTIRTRIAENRGIAPLFDSQRLTRHLESAYEQMAARARAGLPPGHFDVEALPPREVAFV